MNKYELMFYSSRVSPTNAFLKRVVNELKELAKETNLDMDSIINHKPGFPKHPVSQNLGESHLLLDQDNIHIIDSIVWPSDEIKDNKSLKITVIKDRRI